MYQTIKLDLTGEPEGKPDAVLNAMASEGWTVHTVHLATPEVFEALMEKKAGSRVQPPRPATGGKT